MDRLLDLLQQTGPDLVVNPPRTSPHGTKFNSRDTSSQSVNLHAMVTAHVGNGSREVD